jgi:hypothetical protein
MCPGWRYLLPLLLVLASQPTAFAWVRPSFGGDGCTWDATHIVVVTEGEIIDGVVEVQESWKGDLKKGDVITVPQLAAFAPEERRRVAEKLFEREDPSRRAKVRPNHVTCSRMVLFLIKREEMAEAGKVAKITWGPADLYWKQMDVSMLWVEQRHVFGFVQQENPGPSELIPFDETERDLHEEVTNVIKVQTALRSATRPFDQAKAESAVKLLVGCSSPFVRETGITELSRSGKNAVPILRRMLKDEGWTASQPVILAALADAGGVGVGPDLTAVMEEELAFWKKAAPGLKSPRWWNGEGGLEWDDVQRLRAQYMKTSAALKALQELHFAGCQQVVTEMRNFWRSQPQLESVGIGQMSSACESVLNGLR